MQDQKVMSLEDWIIAQRKDSVIREIKHLISENKLKECKRYSWDPQITKQYLRQFSHLWLHKWVPYR